MKLQAASLNEAYSVLSGHFQAHRRSHTGNVFSLVYFRGVGPNRQRAWEPLENIRQRMEEKLEARFSRGTLHHGQ